MVVKRAPFGSKNSNSTYRGVVVVFCVSPFFVFLFCFFGGLVGMVDCCCLLFLFWEKLWCEIVQVEFSMQEFEDADAVKLLQDEH